MEAAAIEAGIATEFVALAIAEQGQRGARSFRGRVRPARPPVHLHARHPGRSVSVARTIPATAREVLESIGRVFPEDPFFLSFRETVGGHPLDGGVMIFNIRPLQFYPATADGSRVGYTPFIYRMYCDRPAPAQRHHPAAWRTCRGDRTVSLRRPQGGPREEPQVGYRIYRDGRSGWSHGRRRGGRLRFGLGALAAAPAIGVGALFAAGTLGWYRWLYRRALAKATEELEALLLAVESSIRAQSVFGGATVPPWLLPPGSPRSGHDSGR